MENENILKGTDIANVGVYYENIYVRDNKGNQYFISPVELSTILSEHEFKIVKKVKRTWLYPVVTDKELASDLEFLDILQKVLDEFEHQTLCETGTRKISGGFANAELSCSDEDWIYITLKWGVQNDVDNDTHEEDWKLDINVLTSGKTIKEMVAEIIECN